MNLYIYLDGKLWTGRAIQFRSPFDAERWARRTFVAGCVIRITDRKRIDMEITI